MVRRSSLLAVAVCTAAVALSAAQPVSPPDEPTILVSRQLRESQGLSIGDVVSLSSSPDGAHPRSFRIAGEYEPTPDPMRLGAVRHEVRLRLPDLIGMTGDPDDPMAAESVDAINVALATSSGATPFARELSAQLPGLV